MKSTGLIVAAILTACNVSITSHAQTSDLDIARAKEKLKSALQDQVIPPAKSAMPRDFSVADINSFRELRLRMFSVTDDLSAFLMRPPTEAGPEAAIRTQDCMIRLAGNFDGAGAKLDNVVTLVALAAKMVDDADLLLVTRLLSNNASGFLEQLKFHQRVLDLTMIRCSQDGATVAKGQEISRLYGEAASLVQSIAKKTGASLLQ